MNEPRDSWEAFGPPTDFEPHIPPQLEPYASDWLDLKRQQAEVDAALQLVESEISRTFAEVEGDTTKHTENFEVTVTRSERWSWDQDALTEIYGDEPLPDFVRRSLTVDKRLFRKLPESEQVPLRRALTRKLGNPKIKVVRCSRL